MSRKVLPTIAVLSLAGAAVSSVSLYHHYGTSTSSFCDFGGNFNCDMVNRSIYSTVMGVPVALIGILGYLALVVVATVRRNKSDTPTVLMLASLAGLVFALYLTYIEKYVLSVWCVLCLSSLGLIFLITLLSTFFMLGQRRT